MFIREIMTENPTTASPSSTVREALQVLVEGDFRHLPVVEESGELVGMLSERDIRGQLLPALVEFSMPESAGALLARSVSEIMSSNVISIHPTDEVSETIDTMLDQSVGALPVVEPDTGELVGIVSYIDVLRAARDLF